MRVAVYLPESSWGDIDEDAQLKGLGGRETALVRLCQEWAKMGAEVYAFVPRKDTKQWVPDAPTGYVRWIPNEQVIVLVPQLDIDLFISWEHIGVVETLRKVGWRGRAAIEMQVAHLHCETEQLKKANVQICALSEWAKRFLLHQHPTFDPDRISVLPNGISESHVHPEDYNDPNLWLEGTNFIYSSSPDRGLHHLLKMWPAIQKRTDEVRGSGPVNLHVCYGIEAFIDNSRWSHREDSERALTIERLINQDGVIYHGRIGQDVLGALQANCDAMLYPADTMSHTETGCCSVIEAMGMRLPVATTSCDCLGEEFHNYSWMTDLPLDYGAYIDTVELALKSPESFKDVAQAFAKTRVWSVIAKQWVQEFNLYPEIHDYRRVA